jgi:hypothetical protein
MKNNRQGFVLELTPETDMVEFQKLMDEINAASVDEAKQLASHFEISEDAAYEIQYVRTRSRWTEERSRYGTEILHTKSKLRCGYCAVRKTRSDRNRTGCPKSISVR